jgi:uncharacterized DUF497 family protein
MWAAWYVRGTIVRVKEVVWDDWNESHIARHRVTAEEVEEVLFSWPLHAERRRNETYAVLGRADSGRWLFVLVSARPRGVVYPVTARDMTQAERRRASAQSPRR